MWYFTSPLPSTLRGSTSSNPAKISSRRALGNVRNHIEASAMAHAHDQFDRAEASGGIENLVD